MRFVIIDNVFSDVRGIIIRGDSLGPHNKLSTSLVMSNTSMSKGPGPVEPDSEEQAGGGMCCCRKKTRDSRKGGADTKEPLLPSGGDRKPKH